MKLVVFGLSITSSWGNGHAVVYRGLLRQLQQLGFDVVFIEKELAWYAENRDLPSPEYARVVLYREPGELKEIARSELALADVALLGSYFPEGILVADLLASRPSLIRLYYDIDTPVTLGSLAAHGATSYLRSDQLSVFEAVLSFTGGPALRELEMRWGVRKAEAFYCALDPEVHQPAAQDPRFRCLLSYMGTYSEDRHAAWESLFLRPALRFPERGFVLAGPQYPPIELPSNVRHFEHVPPGDHSALYSSCDATLNITRAPMAAYGFSPSVRLFEAAGCSACVISDIWPGMEEVFTPGEELLTVSGEDDMVRILENLTQEVAREVGKRARARAIRDHTYQARARQFVQLITRC